MGPDQAARSRAASAVDAEYQAILKRASPIRRPGGQGGDNLITCRTNGMPRMMSAAWPLEFVVLPNITYINFEVFMPRRIYTDGREFPKEHEPGFMGYSIGRWLDTDGDGRFDTLEVETRNFKGPRTYEFSGIPHNDNQSIIRERIYLDKTDRNILRRDHNRGSRAHPSVDGQQALQPPARGCLV